MKKLTVYICFFLFLLASEAISQETELEKIRMAGGSKNVQIFLSFKDVPTFSHQDKGKRIDLILESRLTNTEPAQFTTDDRVVKFLTQEKQDKTIFTFFLRYEPQKYEVVRQDDKTIVLDILLGNQFTMEYPELTTKLQGLTVVTQQGADFANPYVSNPYSNNWRSFFSKYMPEIKTQAPLKFSTPPFPIIDLLPDIRSNELLPEDLFAFAAEELWSEMVQPVLELIDGQEGFESKKLLALTLGEILFRLGDYENAYKQLFLLQKNYSDEYVGIAASYLLARLRCEHEDVYVADYLYRNLNEYLSDSFALSPFIYISQIETALATSQLKRVETLLQKDDIGLPAKIAAMKELRQADYWFATDSLVKAYVGYQLFDEKELLDDQPYSLNGYCSTLFHQKKYEEASQCFAQLTASVTDKEQSSLISLKKAMAELNYKSARDMYVIFSSIEDTYPGTSAGFRAAMKKTDIRYLSQPSWRKTSVKYYRAFAEKAPDRSIAEEAAMKEAIVLHELGRTADSINLLLDLLRNFHSGSLTQTAKALLIEILPAHLQELIDNNQYIDALVLAKKNRELFQKNWLDLQLLSLLAKAYHEVSIFEEAKKLYLFLISSEESKLREKYYLPLVSILYAQTDYELVEDFATQYAYNYPAGKDLHEISYLRLKSLIAAGKETQALQMIQGDIPDLLKIKEVAARLYFKVNDYAKVIDLLADYRHRDASLADDSLFMLAESLFQRDQYDTAVEIFPLLIENPKFTEQTRYRLAQIELSKGREMNSLKLFREIVETGKDPLWVKLAQRELEFYELSTKF